MCYLAQQAFVPYVMGFTQAFGLSTTPSDQGGWGLGDILAGTRICPLIFQHLLEYGPACAVICMII